MIGLGLLVATVVVAKSAPLFSRGDGVVFACNLLPRNALVALFIDTEAQPSDSLNSASQLGTILRYANSNRVFTSDISTQESEWTSGKGVCELETALETTLIPVKVFVHAESEVELAVADFRPESPVFESLDSLGVAVLHQSSIATPLEAFVTKNNSIRSESIGCYEDDENKMPVKPSKGTHGWALKVDEIGVLGPEGHFPLSVSSAPARISALTKGIHLPGNMYDSFIDILSGAIVNKIRSEGGEVRISDCHDGEGVMVNRFASLTVTLADQGGYSIKLPPEVFVDVLPNEECRLNVFRSTELVLGDALFRAGFVQLSRNRDLVICPASMFHPEDRAFDPALPYSERPRPKGLQAVSSVRIAGKDDPSHSEGRNILIGLTVGGIVCIVAVIAFFIVRAKRRQRGKNRDDPRRSMIHDPSVAGSETSSVSEALPQQRVIV